MKKISLGQEWVTNIVNSEIDDDLFAGTSSVEKPGNEALKNLFLSLARSETALEISRRKWITTKSKSPKERVAIAAQPLVFPQGTVWFTLPKVASTSIKAATKGLNFVYKTRADVVAEYNSYHKVAIVRNPFDRLVSCWSDKIMNPKANAGWAKRFEQKLSCYQGMPFAEFVEAVCELPEEISDRHYRGQYIQLCHEGVYLPDYIGKMENLQQSLNDIADLTGLPVKKKLPVRNKSWYHRTNYQEYYNDKLIKMVTKKFEQDLDTFHYTF